MRKVNVLDKYRPSNNEVLHIWNDKCQIEYFTVRITLKYETEPPHGDFIYSVDLNIDGKALDFPFWVYGRNVLFYEDFVVFEGKEPRNGYKGTLNTVILCISKMAYCKLDKWYCEFNGHDEKIMFSNKHTQQEHVFDGNMSLKWCTLL